MNLYLPLAVLALVAILQVTIAPAFAVSGVIPDLMLITVVGWGVLRGVKEGLIWGIMGGLMLDLLSGAPFGLSTVVLALVSLLTGLGEVNVFRANILLPGFAIVLATWVYYGSTLVILELSGRHMPWHVGLLRVFLVATIINAMGMLVLYPLLRWLHRRTGREELVIGG